MKASTGVNVFCDAVQDLTLAVAPFFLNAVVLRIGVSEELGLALGTPPGKSSEIMTACGMVKIDTELAPSAAELTIAALRQALGEATREIDNHNCEYKHVTSKDKLQHWQLLAAGDPAADVLARLDAAGLEAIASKG